MEKVQSAAATRSLVHVLDTIGAGMGDMRIHQALSLIAVERRLIIFVRHRTGDLIPHAFAERIAGSARAIERRARISWIIMRRARPAAGDERKRQYGQRRSERPHAAPPSVES